MSLRILATRFLAMFRKQRLDQRLNDELTNHLEMLAEDYRRKGMTPEEARLAARRELGGLEQMKEAYRDQRGLPVIEVILQDLRYAARMLRKSPGFTTVAVLSLALGIGANTAVFTMVNALLLRMLPVQNPKELVVVTAERKGDFGFISFPMYRDLRGRQSTFTDIFASAGETPVRITVPSPGGAAELDNQRVSFVTGNYFAVLGVQPVIGRLFTEADDRNPHTAETAGAVTVLSYGLWESQFGRDPGAVGRTILIGRSPCKIIGVTPRGFFGEVVGSSADAWVPLVPFTDVDNLENRDGTFTAFMARLKPGMTREQAQAGSSLLFQQLVAAEGRVPNAREQAIVLNPGATGLSYLRRTFEKPLWIVMATVGLVLLIACANVANLLLARAAARRSEVGIRLAIGCSRSRLVAQLLTESLLLSAMGAIAGLGLAYWFSQGLLRMISPGPTPVRLDIGTDAIVLAFLATLGVITGLGFGLVPALQASRLDLAPAMKSGTGIPSSRQRLSRTLVTTQVALSLLLLIGAGLLIRSLRNLHHLDWGFRPEHVVIFDLAHNAQRRDPASMAQVSDQVYRRVRQTPGVDSASVSGLLLFSRSDIGSQVTIRDYTPADKERMSIRFNSVSPGYFETVGMALVEGRSIEERDGQNAPLVAVINQAMARRYLPPESAVGRIMQLTNGPNRGKPIEIVGVVRDAKYNDLRAEVKPMFYAPIAQLPRSLRSLEVRTTLPIDAIAGPVRQALAEVSKDVMIRRVVSLSDQVDQSLAAERLIMRLCSFFGILALLLACIGLYGVMSYAVAQRTGEIGIRMALGATSNSVLLLVLRQALTLVAAGVAIGVPLALASTRLVANFLYGLAPTDAPTIAMAALVLLTAAVLAAYLPARRAAGVDPMVALRYE